ncbi:MAG: DRTGG domain-containing protein [Synergistaceae bacterium]|nr:DRTGG domain-containing protein [Synergistaceae bacterium]
MKLCEVIDALNSEVICGGDGERNITGVITGDLLSFIIGEAQEGEIWVTIQIHLNVAAVAVLKEIPMIILSSGREPSSELADKCQEENIALIVVKESAYEVCAKLKELRVES